MDRRAFLGTLATFAAAASARGAAAREGHGLDGTWLADGMNSNGSRYDGIVQMRLEGSAVAMLWDVGEQYFEGVGTIDGRVITIDWGQAQPVVYVVMPNGELHGTWDGGRAVERLHRGQT